MESIFQLNVFENVVNVILAAMIGALWSYLARFVKEQREANSRNAESIKSMQRAELTRYFRMVVEERKPVSVEEMEHLEKCYEAYRANGGDGTGRLMYERICENACIVTKVSSEIKIGGTE